MQLLDLVTFAPAVARVGVGVESNPFARVLYVSSGAAGVALMKLIVTATLVLVLLWVARRFPAGLLPAVLLATALGVAGFASDVFLGLVR